MKPAAFDYFAPSTVAEAVDLLQQHGDKAKILAGGQSLVPMMNFRVARPEVLIDINLIKKIAYIREESDELAIGALTRQRDVELSPLVREKCPILADALSFVGHSTIRTRGTVGGSLVHADPSAEIATVICCLDARVKVVGPSGERTLQPEEFFLTYLTTSLEPAEILVEVRIPVLPLKAGWSFVELTRRHGDFAIVAAASVLSLKDGGVCSEARIALGGVAPTPIRAREAEEVLAGETITLALMEKAGQKAAEATEAESDYHSSAEYRRDMARVFVRRGLEQAWNRCKGGR